MTRIILVEDEPIIASDMEMILSRAGYEVVGVYDTGEEAIKAIVEHKPDLLLLDIELSGEMDGIALAELVSLRCPTPFLFVTSYFDKHTIERVERVNPAAYIVKPFQEKNILVNIELALQKKLSRPVQSSTEKLIDKLFVKNQHELIGLSTDDVLYIEAFDNYAYVFSSQSKYLLSHTLKSVEQKLTASGFFRIHKSYVINIKHISSIQEGYVFVKDIKLPLGKAYKAALYHSLTIL
jgi:DNA-binding LytR/AlgR family response regulator